MGIQGPATKCDTLRLGFLFCGTGQGHPNASIQRIEHVVQIPESPQNLPFQAPWGPSWGRGEAADASQTEDLAGVECGCLSSRDSKRGERIQRRGLGNVRAGGGHVGTCGGRLGEGELGSNPLPCSKATCLLLPLSKPQFPHLVKG